LLGWRSGSLRYRLPTREKLDKVEYFGLLGGRQSLQSLDQFGMAHDSPPFRKQQVMQLSALQASNPHLNHHTARSAAPPSAHPLAANFAPS
jgi:hypothetical protein